MTNGDPSPDSGPTVGPSDPITLSDPDGAITRVAPWSTWTREQVRAPGGEPSLVTHLQDGQLWFAAGRTRSPWNHEIRIGATSVSTPRGRFHVSTANGVGATVACLSGRTRVVVGDTEPVVLRENQTAAIASDGGTVVVTEEEAVRESDVTPLAGLDDPAPEHEASDDSLLPVPMPRPERRFAGLARVAALIAIVAVAASAIALVLRDGGGDDELVAAPPTTGVEDVDPRPSGTAAPATTVAPTTEPSTATTEVPTTTAAPATTEATATTALPAPTTVAPPVTVATVRSSPDAVATGVLEGCRRRDDAVVAVVDVRHRSGGPGRFRVEIGLLDAAGRPVASGRSETEVLSAGGTDAVEVAVPVDGSIRGACELVGVTVV